VGQDPLSNVLPLPQPLRDPARRVRRDIRAVGTPTPLTSKAQRSNTISIQVRGPLDPPGALLPPKLPVVPEPLVQLGPGAPRGAREARHSTATAARRRTASWTSTPGTTTRPACSTSSAHSRGYGVAANDREDDAEVSESAVRVEYCEDWEGRLYEVQEVRVGVLLAMWGGLEDAEVDRHQSAQEGCLYHSGEEIYPHYPG